MNNAMLEFFKGKELVHALRRQTLVQCDETAAKRLAGVSQCIRLKAGKVLIKQDDTTRDVFFVLQGAVEVFVNGTKVGVRVAGQHVGEMASLLHTRRTATVVAQEESVVAKVSEKEFIAIASSLPVLWRNMAVELACRLNQRRNLIREPNDKPFIFIGSSGKTRDVAEKIRECLAGPGVEIQVWSDPGAFPASKTFIETLTVAAKRADFAIMVFGRDDLQVRGKERKYVPRDNVVFEAGLFIGAISRERTMLVRPKNARLRILSDLAGVTLLDYKKAKRRVDVKPACAQIKACVEKLGVR